MRSAAMSLWQLVHSLTCAHAYPRNQPNARNPLLFSNPHIGTWSYDDLHANAIFHAERTGDELVFRDTRMQPKGAVIADRTVGITAS
jgi:hypothetical protein